jgi:hypothetical protein
MRRKKGTRLHAFVQTFAMSLLKGKGPQGAQPLDLRQTPWNITMTNVFGADQQPSALLALHQLLSHGEPEAAPMGGQGQVKKGG